MSGETSLMEVYSECLMEVYSDLNSLAEVWSVSDYTLVMFPCRDVC